MKKKYLTIETMRSCYSLDQLDETMTVGELIEALSQYDEDMPVAFSNDRGYTYGEISESCLDIEPYDED